MIYRQVQAKVRCLLKLPYVVRVLHNSFLSRCTKKLDNEAVKTVTKKSTAAARALKRFNYENRLLFGPLLNPKVRSKNKPSSEITKPETNVPEIKDAKTYVTERKAEFASKSLSPSELLKIGQTSVLTFPIISGISEDKVPLTEIDSSLPLPSVTKVLNATMPEKSRLALEAWKRRMIQEMGEHQFEIFQKEMLSNGKKLHESIVKQLSGLEPEVIPENQNHWKSLEAVLPTLSDVALLEKPVRHKFLQYHGIVDCVAIYNKRLVVIDWKTSKKPKATLHSLYDSPLQVAAYVGALNFDERYKFQVESAAVILAYESGEPGQIHFLDQDLCLKYWKMWLLRLKTFRNFV